MQYSKFQRFTSFFVLFFFFFSSTIHFPISESSVFADDEWYKNIVSIIVNEEMYPSLRWSLSIYANNISNQLENTKVIILPTPKDATPYEIASLNESLYFEWLKSIDNTLNNGWINNNIIKPIIELYLFILDLQSGYKCIKNSEICIILIPIINMAIDLSLFLFLTYKVYEKNKANKNAPNDASAE